MNSEQRMAWAIVGLFALSCVGFVVLGVLFGFDGAGGAFGLVGLSVFSRLFGKAEKPDERDRSIARRATLVGAMMSYGTFIIGCMGVGFWAHHWQHQEQVSVYVLGAITVAGGIVFFTARSVAILILYGRHVEAEHG